MNAEELVAAMRRIAEAPDDWAEPDITDALTVAADRIEAIIALMNDHDVLEDHAVVYPNKLYAALDGAQ